MTAGDEEDPRVRIAVALERIAAAQEKQTELAVQAAAQSAVRAATRARRQPPERSERPRAGSPRGSGRF